MPVSGATLLRMIRAIMIEEPSTPRVLGVDEWAWRKGQTYGTILCDLELVSTDVRIGSIRIPGAARVYWRMKITT